jgi:Ni/Fe-hydrogenase subunit HybB-like protein
MMTKRPLLTPYRSWILFLGLLCVGGLAAAILIFVQGLWLTNLTDLIPWGLWITIDLSSIALSAGAFLFSAMVYLLKIERFRPLARTAVYVGLIGYSMAMLTLLMDIGRPDRFWHALVFWNVHSPLWEVTMCVMLYFSVLIMETAPILGGASWFKSRWPKISGFLTGLHRFAPVLAVVGLLLSLLHQSSLGATYGILKARPIWYRPGLSVLFIVSAVAAGPAATLLASWVASLFSKKAQVSEELMVEVARIIGFILLAYGYLRFWDTLMMEYTFEPGRSQGLEVLTSGQLSFNFWIGEILLGIVVPAVLLLREKSRSNPYVRGLALLMVVGGLVAYRWDTNLVGLMVTSTSNPQQYSPVYVPYVPALIEYIVGLGVIAYGFLAFTLGVQHLQVVNHKDEAAHGHGLQAAHAGD